MLQWLEDKQSQDNQAPEAESDGKGKSCMLLHHYKTSWCPARYIILAGPELPDWLATTKSDQPKKQIIADQRIRSHPLQIANKQLSARRQVPDAAATEVDTAETEHLLDEWVSDSDEPAVAGKHVRRYNQYAAALVYNCKRSTRCASVLADWPTQRSSAAATVRMMLMQCH